MHPLQSLCTFYMLYIMYLLLSHSTFSIPSYVDCFIRIYIHKIHISIRLSAIPPIHPTHRRFAPPIHSQLFYSIVKSFYANMSWPVKFNNIPDPGTEPQRGNDSPIPIATLYPMVISMALPPESPPSRIRVQHHNNMHYGPISVLPLSRCATPLNLSWVSLPGLRPLV
jgi:hypothetical protein